MNEHVTLEECNYLSNICLSYVSTTFDIDFVFLLFIHLLNNYIGNKTCVINDHLGHTDSPISSDHYFHATFVLFCEILKIWDGRMAGQTLRVKIVITFGHECGLASWTKKVVY